MKRNYIRSLSVMSLSLLAASLLATNVVRASDPLVLKLAHISSHAGPIGVGGDRFAENLKQVSDGKMTVKIFPKASLGGVREIWAQMQAGSIDMQVIDLPAIAILKPGRSMSLALQPFMFESQVHFRRFVESDLLTEMTDDIRVKTGIRYLGIVQDRAPRNISSTSKVVKSVNDLEGLKINIPGDPVFVKLFKSWGAIPTRIPYSDLFMALKSGMTEAHDMGISTLAISPLNDIIKNVTPIDWNRSGVAAWITESRWKQLSDQQREWINEATAISERDSKAEYQQNMKQARQILTDKGITFQEFDMDSFKTASKDFYKQFEGAWPKGAVEKIKAMAD